MAILINGKTPIHWDSNGILITKDPCYTGEDNTIVIYTNKAYSKDSTLCAENVFVEGNPICTKKSYFSKSYGDEEGSAGTKSGTIGGIAEFITASPNVFINGIPAVRAGDYMVSNNRNTSPAKLKQ